jgi:hypothetical protein
VRGWTVVGRDGEKIGKVDDLLVDPARMKVAQLDVDMKGGEGIAVAAQDVKIDRGRREVRIQGYAPGAYQTATAADRTSSRTDDRLTRTEEELRVGTVLSKRVRSSSGSTSRPGTSRCRSISNARKL